MDWVEQLFDGPWAEISAGTEADSERTAREAEFIARQLELGAARRRDRSPAVAAGRPCAIIAACSDDGI